jgi:hypothetical protein
MNLVGHDELHTEDQLRTLWMESMKSVNCTSQHIAYDNFLLLMKGQTKDPESPVPTKRLSALASFPDLELETETEPTTPENSVSLPHGLPQTVTSSEPLVQESAGHSSSLVSFPNTTGPVMDDTSRSMLGKPASLEDELPMKGIAKLPEEVDDEIGELNDIPRPGKLVRGRSKSFAQESDLSKEPDFQTDFGGTIALPQGNTKMSQQIVHQSTLAVSRQFYRAHRQMRVAVLEASRRFEEEQARRARDTLMAEQAKEAGIMGLGQAGLVMRHGHKVHVTTDAIREYLEKYRAEQQELVEKATRRGGRGRGSRKKTISDMGAMMNPSLGQDELATIVAQTSSTEFSKTVLNPSNSKDTGIGDLQRRGKSDLRRSAPDATGPPINVVDTEMIRKATVPGQFHQTKDPFRSDGMYGGARIGLIDVNQIKTGHHHHTMGAGIAKIKEEEEETEEETEMKTKY